MNQAEIIKAFNEEYERLMDAIEGLSAEAMLEPGVNDDWSVKDILTHISAGEVELVKLLWQARAGNITFFKREYGCRAVSLPGEHLPPDLGFHR